MIALQEKRSLAAKSTHCEAFCSGAESHQCCGALHRSLSEKRGVVDHRFRWKEDVLQGTSTILRSHWTIQHVFFAYLCDPSRNRTGFTWSSAMIAASAFAQQKGFRYRIAEGRSPLVRDPHAAFIFNFFNRFAWWTAAKYSVYAGVRRKRGLGWRSVVAAVCPVWRRCGIAYGPSFSIRAWFDRPRSARFRVISGSRLLRGNRRSCTRRSSTSKPAVRKRWRWKKGTNCLS